MSDLTAAPRQAVSNHGDYPTGVATGNGAMPSRPQNNIRDIQIIQLDHGYVVSVGCQRFAIESSTQLIVKLQEYILNPAATEQKWNEKKQF